MESSPQLEAVFKRFEAFEQRVVYKRLTISGTVWTYMDLGNPEAPPLLFLTGGLRHPLLSFASMDLFLDRFRIIAPCYPPIFDLDLILEGIISILRHEGVQHCVMMGSSWGGNMVQCLSYKAPELAEKIILSNTGAIDAKWMSLALKLHLKSLKLRSKQKVLEDYKKRMDHFWSKPAVYQPFWAEMIRRYYLTLFQYEDYVALIENQMDYIERYAFELKALPRYHGPVLILTARDETAGSKRVRDAVRTLYPRYQFPEFDTGAHAVALANPEAYRRRVLAFIDQDKNQGGTVR